MKTLIALCGVALVAVAPLRAQITFEGHGGAGYSQVDVDAWGGSSVNDWDQVTRVGYAQVFFLKLGMVAIGAEAGNQYFFWYNVRIPFGSSTILSDRNVSANRVMGVVRFEGAGRVFGEVAAGAHLFDSFTDTGFAAAVGYKIPLAPKISIPIKLRVDFVNDPDVTIMPVTVSGGISVSL